jgi:hypothetical protein
MGLEQCALPNAHRLHPTNGLAAWENVDERLNIRDHIVLETIDGTRGN